jgi:hypothetical protein
VSTSEHLVEQKRPDAFLGTVLREEAARRIDSFDIAKEEYLRVHYGLSLSLSQSSTIRVREVHWWHPTPLGARLHNHRVCSDQTIPAHPP